MLHRVLLPLPYSQGGLYSKYLALPFLGGHEHHKSHLMMSDS